jgi:hypothetical protein
MCRNKMTGNNKKLQRLKKCMAITAQEDTTMKEK